MRDVYSDDYDSVTGDGPERLIPSQFRKLAGAAVFLGLIGAMGLWSYRLGTRDAAEVPIVRAMEGPSRIQPEDPGGEQAAHQGLEVNSVLAGQPAAVYDAATPPQPAPRVLAEEDGPQGELIVAVPAAPPGAEPKAGDDLRMPAQEAATAMVAPLPVGVMAPGGAEPDLRSELAAMVSAIAPLGSAADALPADPAAAGARPKGRPANLATPRAKVSGAAATPEKAAAAPVKEVSGLGRGARLVQLGAYDSEEIARRAWTQLVARQGDLLGSKSLYIERTTSNARVFYRLRVAGFQDTEQTRAMCEALKARGIDCIPVTLQ